MGNFYDYNSKPRRGGIWTVIGYLSFGILGILLGAALIYGLFAFYLFPVIDEAPVADPDMSIDDEAEEPLEEEPGADVPIPAPVPHLEVDLADVVERVMPAVVGVNRHITVTRFGMQRVEEIESGSGVVLSADGYIATNQHVVENSDKITVVIPEKGHYEAELIGTDALTDLALLRIEETDLTAIPLGDSEEIRVGETVLAIGNPLGYFQQTVTAGIISAVGRQVRIPGSEYAYTFVQTDALINPGNSGGPLVNLKGEVIGINTAKVSLMGVEGIGLSIPSRTVERVMSDLTAYGKVRRPHLGVLIEDWLDYENVAGPDRGVLLVDVDPQSAAGEAGLSPGDIVVAIDGRVVSYLAQLFDQLLAYYPGDTVTIAYYRDGEGYETEVTLRERPDNMPFIVEE